MSNDQHSTPDETPVYRVTLAEQLADEPLTEAEITDTLAELEAGGHVARESLYPGYAGQWVPTARPVRHVPIDGPVAVFTLNIEERLLAALGALGAATVAYGEALDRHATAAIDAYESEATLAYAELDFRAKCYGEGVPGKNEAERKVNLDLAVMDDEALSELRSDADKCRHAKTRAETTARQADHLQKSLREQIAGFSALLKA